MTVDSESEAATAAMDLDADADARKQVAQMHWTSTSNPAVQISFSVLTALP